MLEEWMFPSYDKNVILLEPIPAFDRISLHDIEVIGSFKALPPSMCLFSALLSSGSSSGELCA